MSKKKIIILAIIILLIVVTLYLMQTTPLGQYFTLSYLKAQHQSLLLKYQTYPITFTLSFALIYILITAASLPGAALLTIFAGSIFGVITGTIIVSFSSTIGATCAFLIARWLLRDYFQNKFVSKLVIINKGIQKEGSFYLFALRLVPIFPFFLINIAMGLTSIGTSTFCFVSQIAMLPGTIAYVNAGKELGKIDSLHSILSPSLIISLSILGILPIVSKYIISFIRKKRSLPKFSKPQKFDYNLIVIGAGSGGLVTSYIAATLKAKVALIEKDKMGGDCLYTGCVPSKSLIRVTKIIADAKRARSFGLNKLVAEFDFKEVMEHIQERIASVAPHDSIERYTKLGVDCIQGAAKIISPWCVEINGKIISAKAIAIATGGCPNIPNIPGIYDTKPLTSDNIWELRKQPKHLLILGGGPIGCELAQCFRRLGSKVSIIQRANKLLEREDDDVSSFILKNFQKEGVNVFLNAKPTRFIVDADKKIFEFVENNLEKKLEFDEILVATGRIPNLRGLGLEELGLEFFGDKIIPSTTLQTNISSIYICGDAAGSYQFTHFAAHQAWYAAVNALLNPLIKVKADYRIVPRCTFTDPEIAHVGLTEQEAQKQNIHYEVTKFDIGELDRAIIDMEEKGFIKVLTVPGKDKILGVTIVGCHASDTITEYIQSIKYGIGLNKILKTMHIYPTFGESNKYVAGIWKKKHAPQVLLKILEKINKFRRQ